MAGHACLVLTIQTTELVEDVLLILGRLLKLLVVRNEIDSAGMASELLLADAKHRQVLYAHIVQSVKQVVSYMTVYLKRKLDVE